MDIATVTQFIIALGATGPNGVIALLVAIIVGLMVERKRLVVEISKKDDRIGSIIDEYHNGNLTLSDALNSLKMVLYEIKVNIDVN